MAIFSSWLDTSILSSINDPHRSWGLCQLNAQQSVIRVWRPGARKTYVEVKGFVHEMTLIKPQGLFERVVPSDVTYKDYRIFHQSGLVAHDPYAFTPSLGDWDQHLFNQGVHYELYKILGAHPVVHQGISGVRFAVWAPNAVGVSLVADFNHWDGRVYFLRMMGSSGIWEIFVPGLTEGEKYKFEIHTPQGYPLTKTDPFGHAFEKRPKNAAVVADPFTFQWTDSNWWDLQKKTSRYGRPLNIYEVHIGSWQNKYESPHYRDIAPRLAAYCQKMGYTHVELMPVTEHPLDESWGYQVTGFFAPSSRWGSIQDFQFFVNHLHENHIGVIVDWVPAHFPTDEFSLADFDGTALYEHADPRQGIHPHWNTKIFNYARHEVSNFLIASALFWLDAMHIDGLRVDAVASMIYLDYGRNEGEWIPNRYGSHLNLEAIEFLKHMNSIVHEKFPHCYTFAEESTAFPQVSHPLSDGGLGFDFKWNMGWMNDTLHYFSKDPFFRHYHHHNLTFPLIYAFSEKFVLVLSHDEVVHGKGSLLGKMPGDDWQKFANFRLLYSYQMCHPGKKLSFMGGEIGQWREWSCHGEIDWHLLSYERHRQVQHFVSQMNHFYLSHPALWTYDFDGRGFEWIDFEDRANSVISYLRKSGQEYLLCLHSFTPSYFERYFVRLRNLASIELVFNSDQKEFGGSDAVYLPPEIIQDDSHHPTGCQVSIPPLGTMIFSVHFI